MRICDLNLVVSLPKPIIGAILALCILPSPASARFQSRTEKPNFSGTWKLDKLKGNYAKYARLKPQIDLVLVVLHTDPEIKVTQKVIQNGQQDIRELVYYSDGRGELGRTFIEDSQGKSKTTWRGNKLVSNFSVNVGGGQRVTFDVIQEWKLSKDGNTLTQTQSLRQSNIPITTGSSAEVMIAEELARNILRQSTLNNDIVRVFRRVP